MEPNHKHTELERALRASQARVGELMMEVGKLQAAADKKMSPDGHRAATPTIDTPAFRNRVARMRNMSTRRGKDDYKALVAEIHTWHAGQSASVEDGWSAAPPTEQAWYWHWSGDSDAAPFPLSVLYSGMERKCFVQMNHTHSGQAECCDTYGGYWMRMREPIAAMTRKPDTSTGKHGGKSAS